MRIALPKEYFAEGVDPEVQAAVLKAADQYREMGGYRRRSEPTSL